MRATTFEFRSRFWIISVVFFAGFSCYFVDRRNAAVAMAEAVGAGEPFVHGVFGLGAAVVFAAAALRTWATAYLRATVVKDGALHVDRLVADEPYRHVRNPLYLAAWLLALGFGPTASRAGFAVMVLGMTVFLLRLIGREEEELSAAQGERYAAFRAAVPALWPSLRPRVPAGDTRPQWRQAAMGEMMSWSFGVIAELTHPGG